MNPPRGSARTAAGLICLYGGADGKVASERKGGTASSSPRKAKAITVKLIFNGADPNNDPNKANDISTQTPSIKNAP
jgi:hypothetical protein